MRILSLIFVVIAIFLFTFFYLRLTKNALDENRDPETKSDTRIEYTKKVMEDFNKATEERAKEAEKVLHE